MIFSGRLGATLMWHSALVLRGASSMDGVHRASSRLQLGSARSTVLSVFAEFALDAPDGVPSAAILSALAELGISIPAARQALSRCARVGWLRGVREGRSSRWCLTASGVALLEEGLRRVSALGQRPDPWDGRWFVLIFSVPQGQRGIREHFYRSLRWIGLGSPLPGVWVMPRVDRAERVERLIERMGLRSTAATFAGCSLPGGLNDEQLVDRAWNLAKIAGHYEEVVDRFSAVDRPAGGPAMRTLLQLDEELQRFPSLDPQLPEELVPHWSGRTAAERLLACRAAWLPMARGHWETLNGAANRMSPLSDRRRWEAAAP